MTKWIITALAVIVTAVLIVLFLPKKGEVIKIQPPLVEVSRIDTHSISRNIDLIGYLTPVRQTAALSKAYGKVIKIKVHEGSRVYKNQTLITLQPEEVGLDFKPQPVKAPISGVVAGIMVKEGEPVKEGTPVVTIIDPNDIEVNVSIAGEYYNELQISDKATIFVNSDTIPARIKAKTPVIDPLTRTFNITLIPKTSSQHLVSGLSVTVQLTLEEKQGILAVPNSALRNSKLLLVNKNNVVEQRNVSIGLKGAKFTEITKGVKKGDMVIVFGGQNLTTGQKVRTVVE